MTGLEMIPVAAGAVIRSNDGETEMTVQPGNPIWKDRTRLFLTPEDFTRAVALITSAFGPKDE